MKYYRVQLEDSLGPPVYLTDRTLSGYFMGYKTTKHEHEATQFNSMLGAQQAIGRFFLNPDNLPSPYEDCKVQELTWVDAKEGT